MIITIPDRLAAACSRVPERVEWLELLPEMLRELRLRWLLTLGQPFEGDANCAWVAPVIRRDGSPAVLKLAMPHMEAAHELHALRVWNGNGAVKLLEANEDMQAMLLERCDPGTSLRTRPEPEQDAVIAGLLRRIWQRPVAPSPFRPLSAMLEHWADETMTSVADWPDADLVQEGLRLFEELSRPSDDDVLLATDLHAGNVLEAQREPWLVIDPKPFIGDRAFDATQHLMNCRTRLLADPQGTITRVADLLEVAAERVRLWTFARAAAEPRDVWNEESMMLAKVLA